MFVLSKQFNIWCCLCETFVTLKYKRCSKSFWNRDFWNPTFWNMMLSSLLRLCEKINSFNVVGISPYSLCDKGLFYTLCCFLENQFYQICFLNQSQIEKSSVVASLTFSILISLLVVSLSVFHTWTTFLPLGFTFVSITNFWQKLILFPQFAIFMEIIYIYLIKLFTNN